MRRPGKGIVDLASEDPGPPGTTVEKKLLSSRPALWFLFPLNLSVAAVAPFAIEGSQGVMTAVGMGVVQLGAGVSLVRDRGGKAAPRQSAPSFIWRGLARPLYDGWTGPNRPDASLESSQQALPAQELR